MDRYDVLDALSWTVGLLLLPLALLLRCLKHAKYVLTDS